MGSQTTIGQQAITFLLRHIPFVIFGFAGDLAVGCLKRFKRSSNFLFSLNNFSFSAFASSKAFLCARSSTRRLGSLASLQASLSSAFVGFVAFSLPLPLQQSVGFVAFWALESFFAFWALVSTASSEFLAAISNSWRQSSVASSLRPRAEGALLGFAGLAGGAAADPVLQKLLQKLSPLPSLFEQF